MIIVARWLAVVGAAALLAGVYVPAKAVTAQLLLRLAWERSAAAEPARAGLSVRPWPWARTWPVARLRVPAHGVDAVVLAGAEGAALAFAPGHIEGTARPGTHGNVGIAAHRDTHFRFLADLAPGDDVLLESPGGGVRHYRMSDSRIVDHRQTGVLAPTSRATVTLVTCYPFDAARPGGPLRYVVRAVEVREATTAAAPGLTGSTLHVL